MARTREKKRPRRDLAGEAKVGGKDLYRPSPRLGRYCRDRNTWPMGVTPMGKPPAGVPSPPLSRRLRFRRLLLRL
jgi:hypothetical protein